VRHADRAPLPASTELRCSGAGDDVPHALLPPSTELRHGAAEEAAPERELHVGKLRAAEESPSVPSHPW
jgi:hypothetical protein